MKPQKEEKNHVIFKNLLEITNIMINEVNKIKNNKYCMALLTYRICIKY